MEEYIENGAELGWLINRTKRQVEIYRPNREVEILDNPKTVSGENVLPGFFLRFSYYLVKRSINHNKSNLAQKPGLEKPLIQYLRQNKKCLKK